MTYDTAKTTDPRDEELGSVEPDMDDLYEYETDPRSTEQTFWDRVDYERSFEHER